MKEEPKAVLIDLFGTLCGRTSPEERIMEEWKLPPSVHESLQRAVCGTKFEGDFENYFRIVLREAGIEYNPSNRKKLADIFNESIEDGDLFPETKDVLEELRSRYLVALISDSNPFVRKGILEKNDLLKYFNLVSLSYEVGMTKQDPDVYKRALEMLKVSGENAVMVGDNFEGDILSSKRATLCKIGGILISDNAYLGRLEKFAAVPKLFYVPGTVEKYFSAGHF